jgi:hypothetical protein
MFLHDKITIPGSLLQPPTSYFSVIIVVFGITVSDILASNGRKYGTSYTNIKITDKLL